MGDGGGLAISVGELAAMIQGEVLNSAEKSDELVENVMVGAMCVDPAPAYFNVKSHKAVVTRGDRADIQLGALETPTSCLIVTGGVRPLPTVLRRAEEKGVPVIVASKDTASTLADIEAGLSRLGSQS